MSVLDCPIDSGGAIFPWDSQFSGVGRLAPRRVSRGDQALSPPLGSGSTEPRYASPPMRVTIPWREGRDALEAEEPSRAGACGPDLCFHTFAGIEGLEIGGDFRAADHVR